MKKIKKLSLNKEVIANLDQLESSNIKGGFSGGCTDGCTGSFVACSAWNCSKGNCTDDCDTLMICASWSPCGYE